MRALVVAAVFSTIGPCLAGDVPTTAPSNKEVADALALPQKDVKTARANIDPILARQQGILWDRYYTFKGASKDSILRIAVLSPKYLPTPSEAVGDPKKAVMAQRRLVDPNGNIVFLHSCPRGDGRSEYVVRMERQKGDWDLLFQIIADDAAKRVNAAFFEDPFLLSCSSKVERFLAKSVESGKPPN